MGPHYDSIYLMVRQLPEPPEFHTEADAQRSTAPIFSGRRTTTTGLGRPRTSLLVELLRVLKQPVRRTWAAD